jgi:hypothetical protein
MSVGSGGRDVVSPISFKTRAEGTGGIIIGGKVMLEEHIAHHSAYSRCLICLAVGTYRGGTPGTGGVLGGIGSIALMAIDLMR